jgi:capsular polysaccharide biosynthesis protein
MREEPSTGAGAGLQDYPVPYDEIDLLDIFRSLWRGRYLIGCVTIAAMLVSGFVSFFVLRPVYEAKALILITGTTKTPQTAAEERIRDVLSTYELGATLETFQQQVVSQEVLSNALAKSGLDKDLQQFSSRIKATIVKGTNLIEVTARDSDAGKAAELANLVVEEYVAFLDRLSQEEIAKTAGAVERQLQGVAENLKQATEEYEKFLKAGRSSAELREEMTIRTQVLAQYRGELLKAEVQRDALEASIAEYEAELKKHPRVLVATKSILEDPLMRDLSQMKEGGGGSTGLNLSVVSEEINSTYVDLTSGLARRRVDLAETTARRKAILDAIARIEHEMEALRLELARRQAEEDQILSRLSSAKQQFSSLSEWYDKARLGEGLDMGQATVHVVSRALVPQKPVLPRRALNVTAAGMLGIMISALIALVAFREGPDSKRSMIGAGPCLRR